ncbi:barstar family protein [Streptomyces sp. NPDC018947]|uniref:barstar family protein n=1 Tax=Streptomyces sp. NPDC018947 TaxID=3365054 RepID=UPI0037B769BB
MSAQDESLDTWVDVEDALPWLPAEPYFIAQERHGRLLETLPGSGLSVLEIDLVHARQESDLQAALGHALDKPAHYADNWDALRDLLKERGASTPWAIAIVFTSAPAFLRADVHGFVRAVSVLHNMSRELSNIDEFYGQLELFYVGEWLSAH